MDSNQELILRVLPNKSNNQRRSKVLVKLRERSRIKEKRKKKSVSQKSKNLIQIPIIPKSRNLWPRQTKI